MSSARAGFTMLTVLWVLSMAGVLATSALVAGRNGIGAARNRVEWQRARWAALGCARRAESTVDERLHDIDVDKRARLWQTLGNVVDSSSLVAGCVIDIEAAGTKLDVNAATPEMLERLFAAQGVMDARLVAAAFVSARASTPIADLRALSQNKPMPTDISYDSILSTEPARIALSSASAVVLRAIPGFTLEVAEAVVAHRANHAPLADLNEVIGLVSRESARELEDRFQDLARVATVDPDAWILRSTAVSGVPAIVVVVEWRLVRQNDRVVVFGSRVR
ncbi:MAG TPA: hypothetical protein VGM82_05190 [Gemmatimonadaceae bacterium]